MTSPLLSSRKKRFESRPIYFIFSPNRVAINVWIIIIYNHKLTRVAERVWTFRERYVYMYVSIVAKLEVDNE